MIKKQVVLIFLMVVFVFSSVWAQEDVKRVGVMDLTQQRKEAEYVTRKVNGMLRDKFSDSEKFETISKGDLKDGLKELSKDAGFDFDLDTSLLDEEAITLGNILDAQLFVMGNVGIADEEERFKITVFTFDVDTKERTTDEYITSKDKDDIEAACDSVVEGVEMLATESKVKYLKYAREYYKVGHYEDAIQAFQRVLEFDPDHFESLQTLGFIYEKQSKNEKAEEYYLKALDVKPSSGLQQRLALLYKQKGEYEKALEAFDKALELDPENPADIYVNKGMIYYQDMAEYDKAAENYKKAIEIDSTYTYAITNLGFIYNYQQKWDEAIPLFERAIELNPEYTPSYEKLATAYENKAKSLCAFNEPGCDSLIKENRAEAIKAYNNAIDVYERLYEIQPERTDRLYTIGLLYDTIKEYEKSVEWLEKYLEQNPDDMNTFCRLGFAYGSMGDDEKAKETADRMLERDPESACANVILADIQATKKFGCKLEQLKAQKATYQQAVALYQKAIELAGADEIWLSNYAKRQVNNLSAAVGNIAETIDKIEWGEIDECGGN
jgi:tetratricopeptide (TPR) repeat protein